VANTTSHFIKIRSMEEDDWMNTDVNALASKFEDEDKPEEKKEVKVI